MCSSSMRQYAVLIICYESIQKGVIISKLWAGIKPIISLWGRGYDWQSKEVEQGQFSNCIYPD